MGPRIGLADATLVGVHSQHVVAVRDQLHARLAGLIRELEPMSTEFQGSAGSAFQNLKAAYADRQSGLDAVLGQVAVALSQTQTNYATGEDEGSTEHRQVMSVTSSISTRINPAV